MVYRLFSLSADYVLNSDAATECDFPGAARVIFTKTVFERRNRFTVLMRE